jgi:hypothetical protein
MFIENLGDTLENFLKKYATSDIEDIIIKCIEESRYSLKKALTDQDITNEIRTTLEVSLHKFHKYLDICIEKQIELWNGKYFLSFKENMEKDENILERIYEKLRYDAE